MTVKSYVMTYIGYTRILLRHDVYDLYDTNEKNMNIRLIFG